MKAVFIAGTDTGAGKTYVTRLLADYFTAKGYKVAVQKWVETGVKRSRAVYAFKLPASPHLAAKSEGRVISVGRIKREFMLLTRSAEIVIVEGTGGLMVPVAGGKLLIDIVKELKIPVLLVAANRIGAINHTLLSIEALRARNMRVLGLIFNDLSRRENRLVVKDNPKIVGRFAGKIPVWTLPYKGKFHE
jgi:dethiobiotin synthetase